MEKVVEKIESGKKDALLDIRALKLGFKDGNVTKVIFNRIDASASAAT